MYWGNKETYISSLESEESKVCPVCNTDTMFEYRLIQKSVTVLGLSLFPTSKLVKSVCGNCGATRKVKRSSTTHDIMDSGEVDELLNMSYGKLRFFSALFVLIALAGLVYYTIFMK